MNNIKIAETQYPVIDLIRNRWSPRSFSTNSISDNDILSIIEAARWAPSAFNEQPWRFIVANRNEDTLYSLVFETLVEFNKTWVQYAPVLIVCCSKMHYTHNNKNNSYAAYDTGQAVAYMTIEAMSRDIYMHQMGGFDKELLSKNLNIPDGFEIQTLIAMGKYGQQDKLPEDIIKSENTRRERKTVEELTELEPF